MHGYIGKSKENDPKIDHKTSNSWKETKICLLNSNYMFLLLKTRKLLRSAEKAKRKKGNA